MWHAYGNANGDAHIHSDGDCDGNCHIHSDSDCDGNCHIHANGDSHSDIYCNGYSNRDCDSNCDRTAAAYTDATASSDTAASPLALFRLRELARTNSRVPSVR